MAGEEVTLDEVYAEVDKRITALKTELTALIDSKFKELEKKLTEKPGFKIVRRA